MLCLDSEPNVYTPGRVLALVVKLAFRLDLFLPSLQ
jgi:hypothetical protein